ncbi:hypothetical protein [Anditalea andensis]|uniref:Outer membrane protein beta-barrel domain-containing protein n=1 Tax=Anditalea andensis TaxID=1048983 RepID=A0A074L6A7_9BACT|nr:hypothetical protein [Anditalea andensis]KEO75373.1 hypothetical protein EL17_02205 [Anditalea andensis]
MNTKIFTLITALTLFLVLNVNAQVDPRTSLPPSSFAAGEDPIMAGNWIVGGSIGALGYNFSTDAFNVNINPRAGFFIMDNVALGLGISTGLATVPNLPNVWSYGVTPFARYYFPEGATATSRFFGEVEAGLGGSTEASDFAFLGAIRAGYAHFITSDVALEATLGYSYSRANINTPVSVTGLGIGLGLQIYLTGRRNR